MVTSVVWQIEHNEELLALFGKVCVRWAALDLQLVMILAICLENYEAARALIMDGVGAGKSRLDGFNRVIGASKYDEDERKRILDLTRSAASLLGARNRIVHSPLVTNYSVDGRKISSTLHQIDRGGKSKPVSLAAIRKHVDAVGAVLDDLDDLALELSLKYEPLERD